MSIEHIKITYKVPQVENSFSFTLYDKSFYKASNYELNIGKIKFEKYKVESIIKFITTLDIDFSSFCFSGGGFEKLFQFYYSLNLCEQLCIKL